jgi:RNA recognition motif-containing protein
MTQKRFFIGNIPFDATTKDIMKFFEPHHVSSVKMINDRETGRPRGFGFIESPEENARDILALNGREMGGRRIAVRIAEERKQYDRKPQVRDEYVEDRD